MSLRLPAVDRLFDRLGATYGAGFSRLYGSLDAVAVKTVWAHELDAFDSDDGLRRIAWALENLPEVCPNVIQFRNLCRQAPVPHAQAPKLPEPEANPERMHAELAKLRGLMATPTPKKSGVDWARQIVAKAGRGERVSTAALAFAQDALQRTGGGASGGVGYA